MTTGFPQKRILLVEDEFIMAQAESRRLSEHGFDVSSVLSGEEAVDTLKRNTPVDLVLIDLLLGPGMGGHETAREILKLKDIPIIFLTSHNEQEIVDRVREIPHYGYVLKNSGEFTLVSTIEAALERHRVLSALRVDHACLKEMANEINGGVCRAGGEHSRSLADHMLNGFARCRMIYDASTPVDFEFLEVNHAFEHVTGLQQVTGKKVTEVFPGLKKDHAEIFERFDRVASTGIPEKFEVHVEPLSLWLNILIYSCRKGEFTALFENITELRKSEEEVKYAQNLYRLVFDHSQEGMFLTAPDGRIFDCNEAVTHMLGYTREEIMALGREGLLAPDNPHLKEGLEKRTRAGHAAGELIFVKKDGSRLIADVTSSLFRDQRGELRSSTIIRDVTERRQMEQELQSHRAHLEELVETRTLDLQQANRRLEAESAAHRIAREGIESIEKELRLTLEATTDGIWSWDLPASLSFSPRYYTMLGYEPGEFPATYENWVALILPEDREMALSVAERYLKTKTGRYENTFRLRTKEGKYRWIRATGTVVDRDSEGNALRIIGNHEDITDRKEIEQELKASLREKELLLTEIHHRVKNNLNIVSNLLSLQEKNFPDQGLKRAFQESRDRIRSIALIHDTLYSTGNMAAVDCGTYLQRLVDSIALIHGRKAIRFIIETGGMSIEIQKALPVALIANELITNSLKHAFPGGGEGEITIALSPAPGGMMTLAISDNGRGLPEELDFKAAGTMGARLVQSLVSQLRGTMHIQREKGTTFMITFPG